MRFSNLSIKKLLVSNNPVISYPTPPTLAYSWSFSGLVFVVMTIQIVTGIFLAMHYSPDIELAFYSVEKHIMRDVNDGWLLRYLHANGASFAFALMYVHAGRTLYHKTYNFPRHILWSSGVAIFFLSMATAFIGYVLPWGQLSFWGATVITNLFSAIPVVGHSVAAWLWGGFSVASPTLVRFFSLHYLMSFIIIGVFIVHISILHETDSTNSLSENQAEESEFSTYFIVKNALVFTFFLIFVLIFVHYFSNSLGHPYNAVPANPFATPRHIVPEWYFLPFYAILKSLPSKRLGVVFMALSILIFLVYADSTKRPFFLLTRGSLTKYWYRTIFWLFVANFFVLGWVGANPAQPPFVQVGAVATVAHFWLLAAYIAPFPAFIFKLFWFIFCAVKELADFFKKNRENQKLKNGLQACVPENFHNKEPESKLPSWSLFLFLLWLFGLFSAPGLDSELVSESRKIFSKIAKYIIS